MTGKNKILGFEVSLTESQEKKLNDFVTKSKKDYGGAIGGVFDIYIYSNQFRYDSKNHK